MDGLNYEEIYGKFHDKVLYYIRGKVSTQEDAEDLCADVFVKAYENIDKYDKNLGEVSTWIYRIAHNAVIDYYRKNRPGEELGEDIASSESIEDAILKEEDLGILARALEKLSEKDRAIIIFRYYDRLSLKEIAEKLNISYSGCKLRHQNALNTLKGYME